MKLLSNLILSLACSASLAALPARGEPGPTPSPTPHEEPSATLHEEPSPTPDEQPSATPGDDNGGDDSGGDDAGGDDQGSDNGGNSGDDNGDNSGDDGDQGKLSLHGFYEGITATGALAVFYIETNTHVQINVLDVTGQTIGFAEGTLTNGSFAFTLTNGEAISGVANEDQIEVNLAGESFAASHLETFADTSGLGGRYVGVANGPTGQSPVMFLIDANNNIVMVQNASTGRSGGYGTVTPSASAASPSTFLLDHVIGSTGTITGSFTIVDGVFSGSFTTSAGTYTVTSFKNTLANRMANISTRGLVGPGQGQLIGGFIITGGPKMVLIRALGPSLAAAGVSPVAANPSLQLFAGGTLLASNDDWGTNANAAQLTATHFAPTDPNEAALLVRLEPGAYTTILTNGDGATAIALVEVYEMGE
ncbi:MAG: hypothetical protein ABIR29_05345 [Chthoniobacterales bacterium]